MEDGWEEPETVGGRPRLKVAVIFRLREEGSMENFWQRACIICGGHSGAVYELGFFRNETPLALAINIILNLI